MKIRFLLLAGMFPAVISAQITITGSDLPQAGDEWGLYTDADGGAAFAITPPGPNPQTWNYANAFDNLSTFGFQWQVAASVPGSGLFPNADLGIDYEGYSSFLAAESDGLYNVGGYFSLPDFTDTEHATGDLILPVPFTSGGVRTAASISTTITVFDSGSPAMKSVRRRGLTYTCDAFGTMMTPTYPSGTEVLRIEVLRGASTDSIFLDMTGLGNGPWTFSEVNENPGNTSHLFFGNGATPIVADIAAGGLSATYYSDALPEAIAENGSRVREILAYPVPSSNDMVHIPIGGSDIHSLEVVNAVGGLVRRINVHGTDLVNLATGQLAPGPYSFRCLNEHGAAVGQGRFVVAR